MESYVAGILSQLVVWVTPAGEPVYIQHCRQQPQGCEAYVRKVTDTLYHIGVSARIDPYLLAAVALHETSMNPNTVGGVGERGIFQVHPKSPWWRATAPYGRGLASQTMAAAMALRDARSRCSGILKVLGAYNTGRCVRTTYARRVQKLFFRLHSVPWCSSL